MVNQKNTELALFISLSQEWVLVGVFFKIAKFSPMPFLLL